MSIGNMHTWFVSNVVHNLYMVEFVLTSSKTQQCSAHWAGIRLGVFRMDLYLKYLESWHDLALRWFASGQRHLPAVKVALFQCEGFSL